MTCTLRLCSGALIAIALCVAQSQGRFTELIARGIALLERGKFNDAINTLEEVWEQDQSDPAIAENLAMGYLYADHDVERARKLAEHAIRQGGRASFLVQHPHEKFVLLSGDLVQYCSGRLSISQSRLVFTATDPQHSLVIEGSNFKEMRANRVYGAERGMYHIRTAGKKNYNFRPRTWSDQETELILFLIKKYVTK